VQGLYSSTATPAIQNSRWTRTSLTRRKRREGEEEEEEGDEENAGKTRYCWAGAYAA